MILDDIKHIQLDNCEKFSDFATSKMPMPGVKKRIEQILNRDIVIVDFRVTESKHRQNSKCLQIQFLMDGEVYDIMRGKVPIPHVMVPLYVVLTLSATASENDAGGVISNPPTKEKLGTFFGEVPVASAVDPTIQFSLPKWQVMCGASDALSHLMEGMFSLDGTCITGRQINFGVQKAVFKAMEILKVPAAILIFMKLVSRFWLMTI